VSSAIVTLGFGGALNGYIPTLGFAGSPTTPVDVAPPITEVALDFDHMREAALDF
jgi:hypothetical protein